MEQQRTSPHVYFFQDGTWCWANDYDGQVAPAIGVRFPEWYGEDDAIEIAALVKEHHWQQGTIDAYIQIDIDGPLEWLKQYLNDPNNWTRDRFEQYNGLVEHCIKALQQQVHDSLVREQRREGTAGSVGG